MHEAPLTIKDEARPYFADERLAKGKGKEKVVNKVKKRPLPSQVVDVD